ncbi:tRNA(Ile)-lysidine synthase [Rhizobium sp. RU20A]|nr:tRNA(Ile)-lysidine synthase [Rhizobium sp. RU20A]
MTPPNDDQAPGLTGTRAAHPHPHDTLHVTPPDSSSPTNAMNAGTALPAPARPKACASPVEMAAAFLATLTRPGPLLVAISGGSDSRALLLALHAAGGRNLVAATVDHRLRAESAAEADEVAALAATLSIPHETLPWHADKPRSGLMAAARMARYDLLCDAARRHGAVAVVTGHTATDQAETRTMRRLRSGDETEAGMADAVLHMPSGVWILRPFLSLERDTLRAYLRAAGHGWIDDPSNSDPRFERARLRRAGAVPDPVDAFPLAGDRDLIRHRAAESGEAAAFLRIHLQMPTPRIARLSPGFLAELPGPAARRALFTLARILGGRQHGPGRLAEDRLLAFLAAGTPGRRTASRTVFDRRRDGLWLYRESRDLPSVTVPAGETTVWDNRLRIINPGPQALTVGPSRDPHAVAARLTAIGLPSAIARRAAPGEPDLPPTSADANPGLVPLLAPWDTFLPRFDLTIASLVAERVGLPAIAPPPVATN